MYAQTKRPRALYWHAGVVKQLLLAGIPGCRGLAEPPLEPRDATAGVEDLLLARVERVAVRAHVGVDHAVRRGGPRHERVPAATGHGGDLVGRVNVRLHLFGSLSQAVAGSPRGREPVPRHSVPDPPT